MGTNIKVDVAVLGAGPGGYTAAFRAADLGLKVALVERYPTLGGVCLNVGCIPSKTLLHIAYGLNETKTFNEAGIDFAPPQIDTVKIVAWKNKIIKQLTSGLAALAKQRQIQVVTGKGYFTQEHTLSVEQGSTTSTIQFKSAIIAVGSESITLPFIPQDKRIFSSTGALELRDIQGDLLVLGGGIIGLEMATVYVALGVPVTVVEFADQIISTADLDLVQVLQKRMQKKGVRFLLKTKLTAVEAKKEGLIIHITGEQGSLEPLCVQQMLVAVGRKPNGRDIGADQVGIKVDEQGFIPVDKQQRTNIPYIYAIGDVVGQPMLAHKAIPEGKIAAEVIAGKKHYFDPRCIPSIAYTDPEVAWCGLTEKQAQQQGITYEKAVFPWVASGRALSMARGEGLTKLLFCPETKRVLGAGIVGCHAGELMAEVGLAIEMGCDVEDLALTIHAHPTLSETVAQAAELFAGSITDLLPPKKKS